MANTKRGRGGRLNEADKIRRKGERKEGRKAGTAGKEGVRSVDEDMKCREFCAMMMKM